jgi:hypothetical protein
MITTRIGSQIRATVELALIQYVFMFLCEVVAIMSDCDVHSGIIVYAVNNIKTRLIEIINDHAIVAARTAAHLSNENDLFVDDDPYEEHDICDLVIIIRNFIKDVFLENPNVFKQLCCVLWNYRDSFFPGTFSSYHDFMTRKLPTTLLEANVAFRRMEHLLCLCLGDMDESACETKLRLVQAKNVCMANLIAVRGTTNISNTRALSLFLSICEELGDMTESVSVDGAKIVNIRNIIDRCCVFDQDLGYALHQTVWNVVIPSFGLQGVFKNMETYLSLSE